MRGRETLTSLLDGSAARWPKRPALVVPRPSGRGERTVTFEELRHTVLRCSAALRARGIGKGDSVALVHRNGLEFVVMYFALTRLGAAAVPINFMISKPDELRYMTAHSGAKGVLTQREFLKSVAAVRRGRKAPPFVWVSDPRPGRRPLPGTEDFWSVVGSREPEEESAEVSPEDTAAVLYTSGTTGRSKGVMLSHANLVSNCDASIRFMKLTRWDVMLTILPMFHTFAWTVCVLIPLRLGALNVVAPSIMPASHWLRLMSRYGVSLFAAVPQVYAVLVKQAAGLKRLALRYWFFRKVRLCISGAAPLAPGTLESFRRTLGKTIIEGYGLTETSPVATVNPRRAPRPGSVGLPIEGVELRIADDAGSPLETGEEGEVCIRGPNVMKGYLDDAEATKEALSPDGWFRTGDIGALDGDGYLYIRDRKKDMIIVKGLKVFSAQVEAAIVSHPDVEEAAVVGVPDASGDETIKAFAVLREGARAGKSELLAFCREKLDPYKRPRDIEVVESLPKNALQKVLKRVLRAAEIEKSRKPAA